MPYVTTLFLFCKHTNSFDSFMTESQKQLLTQTMKISSVEKAFLPHNNLQREISNRICTVNTAFVLHQI